jgi:hypothetical protein
MRSWLFYPIALATAVGLIGIAVMPGLNRPSGAAEARPTDRGLLLDGDTLNRFQPVEGFYVTPSPGLDGSQTGPRLATEGVRAVDPDLPGVRLALGPMAARQLASRPVTAFVQVEPIPYNAATGFALGLVDGAGKVSWVAAPVPPEGGTVRIGLPAVSGEPSALAIWPSLDGGGKGLEVRSIRFEVAAP